MLFLLRLIIGTFSRLLVGSSADEGSKDLEILVLRRAVGGNALRPSSRPDQRSSVCSRPGSATMATVCRL